MTRCKRDHAAMKADPATWESLPYVGMQRVEADESDPVGSPAYVVELRDCTCGSTLAKVVGR